MPPKIDIEEVRRLIEKELEPINEKLAILEEKYNTLQPLTLSQHADIRFCLCPEVRSNIETVEQQQQQCILLKEP